MAQTTLDEEFRYNDLISIRLVFEAWSSRNPRQRLYIKSKSFHYLSSRDYSLVLLNAIDLCSNPKIYPLSSFLATCSMLFC